MNIKKLVMSGGMLVFVAAVVVGGTGAFFSDTETSTGNVFTAGSVSIDLLGYEHEWLGAEGAINEDDNSYFQTILSDGNLRYQFNDLKPGDFGEITKELENGANDAFWCARNSVTSEDQPFIDMLKLQVNNGSGVTVNAFYDAPFDEWYSLDTDDTTSPFDGALAVDANETEELKVRYCFGDFEGSNNENCVVNNPLDGDYWNQAQNQEITVDVEFYAVQQRNNPDFSCADLNEDGFEIQTADNWPTTARLLDSEEWKAEGRYGDGGGPQTWEIGVGTDTQGTLQANGNYSWENGDSVPFTVEYDSTSGDATFTVDGNSQTYEVNSNADKLAFVARGTDDVGSVTLTDMEFDGSAVASELEATDGPKSIVISGLDLSQDFIASGNVEFNWSGSPSGSELLFQVVAGN